MLWGHFEALDASNPLDPPACPSPPTYNSSPGELRYTGLAVPDQTLCTLVNFFTVALNSPAKAHLTHFLAQTPAVILPFIVEGTRNDGSYVVSHFVIGTLYQLRGAGMVTPVGYLLILRILSSVRDRTIGTVPLTHPQAKSILLSLLLGYVFPSVMMRVTLNPYWIAFWQPFPWWMSLVQTLYLVIVPPPPPSSPYSKPGSGSALFVSTLRLFYTAAWIAHWVFLYHVFTSPSFSLSSLLTFSWLPSLSIPPHDIPLAEAIAHFLEWDAVVCYLTGFIGSLWMLLLALTETPSVGVLVWYVLLKVTACVVVGPGAMLCAAWEERENALVDAWKAEKEKRR